MNNKYLSSEKINGYYIFIELATKILFAVIQNMYESQLRENGRTNYNQVRDKFKVTPSKPLVYAYDSE
jgi:hypothetical protein